MEILHHLEIILADELQSAHYFPFRLDLHEFPSSNIYSLSPQQGCSFLVVQV